MQKFVDIKHVFVNQCAHVTHSIVTNLERKFFCIYIYIPFIEIQYIRIFVLYIALYLSIYRGFKITPPLQMEWKTLKRVVQLRVPPLKPSCMDHIRLLCCFVAVIIDIRQQKNATA